MKKITIIIWVFILSIFASSPSQASSSSIIEQLCATDCKSEFQFFRRYARQGSSLADLSLAIMYLRGQGTKINISAGRRHLMRAANAGEPGAQYQLAYFLMYGMYLPQDIEKALNWFKRAVKSKVHGAQQKVDIIISLLNKSGIENTRKHFIKEIAVNTSEQGIPSNIEVITVNFGANYKHILEAARWQTCNTKNYVCPQQWRYITAPIIVLKNDVIF